MTKERNVELDEAGNSGKHGEMLAAGWKTITDSVKGKKKKVNEGSAVTDMLTDKAKKDKEVKKEETVQEDSEAMKTLKPHSRDVADPKSRIETMKSVIGHMASMSDDSLQKWWYDAVKVAGHPSEPAPHDEAGNKNSIGAKPSDAQGTQDGAGTFKMPLVSVKEDLDVLFSKDETLTEETKETMKTLFEAAVAARVILEREELEAELVEAMDEISGEIREELEGQLDTYLDYVVQSWLEENIVAIDSTLRTELSEEFIDGMRGLFAEHFIDIPEDKVDLVEALTAKVAELEASLNEAVVLVNELRGDQEQNELQDAFDAVADDLSDAQKEKFEALAEGVEFTGDLEAFTKKLTVIKENFFPGQAVKEPAKDDMDATGEVLVEEVQSDPRVDYFAKALGKNK